MIRSSILLASLLFLSPSLLFAQDNDYAGYLGVFVVEGNGGMTITGFIDDTPAKALSENGEISRKDTIIKLAGKPTTTLKRLRQARNSFLPSQKARMVLQEPNGNRYHVWITRNPATAAAARPADSFSRAHEGDGDGPDVVPVEEGDGDGDSDGDGPDVVPNE
jgi:hypothetical protein